MSSLRDHVVVIPARAGSKGLPGKNRILFDATAVVAEILMSRGDRVIVTTDDDSIADFSRRRSFDVHTRSPKTASDTSSIKSVMNEVVSAVSLGQDTVVTMLYLTYPQRTMLDVGMARQFFEKLKASSMLCRKPVKVSPYLCMYPESHSRAKQVIQHSFFRRQDYPECFELSHFISQFVVGELPRLNDQLFNDETVYFPIPQGVVDVDLQSDMDGLRW